MSENIMGHYRMSLQQAEVGSKILSLLKIFLPSSSILLFFLFFYFFLSFFLSLQIMWENRYANDIGKGCFALVDTHSYKFKCKPRLQCKVCVCLQISSDFV